MAVPLTNDDNLLDVLDDYGLDPHEFRVYAKLVMNADEDGRYWGRVADIAKSCKMSNRKVLYCLRSLEKNGLISRGDRLRNTPTYALTHQHQWVPPAPVPRKVEKRYSGNTSSKFKRYRDSVLADKSVRCWYCGCSDVETLDHVLPVSRGGGDDKENLVPVCNLCNSSKGRKTLEEYRASVAQKNGVISHRFHGES